VPGVDTWLSLLWVLVCIVLILGLAYWFTRHVASRGGLGVLGADRGTEQLRVLARLALGRDQFLALVQAGERYLLLGVTPSSVSLLTELTQEEAKAWSEEQKPPPPPGFQEALHTVLQQKRQR